MARLYTADAVLLLQGQIFEGRPAIEAFHKANFAAARFNCTWTINGDAWPKVKPMMVEQGKRYRMLFRNASGDQHPMHLHRHSFEVTKIDDKPTSGLMKDVVNVMPLQTLAVDFIADNPGDSLMHCHQQLHMDYGFMQIVKYKA